MGIGLGITVPREVLGHRGDAPLCEAAHQAGTERAHGSRIEVQRAIADHRAAAVIEVQHRREAEVHAMRTELRGDDVADRSGGFLRRIAIAVPQLAQRAHRRDGGEAVAKALHAAAFVIHADRQHRLTLPLDIGGQRGELVRVFVVAREEDHRARRRMAEARAIFVGERGAEHIHHHRPGRQPYFSHSRMTVANATPRSSESETWAVVTPFAFR